MPISGLVVSLVSDRQLRDEALELIRMEPRIEVGAMHANRMAIVLDTPTIDEDKRLWCWLSSLPGVVFVDLAMVAFDPADPLPSSSQAMNVVSADENDSKEKSADGN
jgi:hypothetical protein